MKRWRLAEEITSEEDGYKDWRNEVWKRRL